VLSSKSNFAKYEYFLRDMAFGTSRILCAALLLNQAIKSGRDTDVDIFIRWVNMSPLYQIDKELNYKISERIALD